MAPYKLCKLVLEGKPIKINGEGDQSRDFTYIDDVAKGTILAQKNFGYEIVNSGRGKEPISINKFVLYFEEITGKKQ